jgi:hypothetical protein
MIFDQFSDTIVADMTQDFISKHNREPSEVEKAEILQETARYIEAMEEEGDEAGFEEQFEVIR